MSDTAELELREQFSIPAQQEETSTFGMWIFLATEVLLFGGLFASYAVYRLAYTSAFNEGSSEMEYTIGAVNTAVLICSSFTMALAVASAETARRMRTAALLALTMLIGSIFLILKFYEYYRHYVEHKVPGFWFESHGPEPGHVQLFFVFYFLMTGLHAIHMLIGLTVVGITCLRVLWGSVAEAYHTPVDIAGLYWHFIDVVWVFLFAVLYIPGAHLK